MVVNSFGFHCICYLILLTSILTCYFTFNSTLEKYEGLDYWLRFGMMKDVANTTVWTSIFVSNIVSIFMATFLYLRENYYPIKR